MRSNVLVELVMLFDFNHRIIELELGCRFTLKHVALVRFERSLLAASATAQVSGLRTTTLFISSIIFVTLLLALWAVIKERRLKTATQKA